MTEPAAVTGFKRNLAAVHELMHFDGLVLRFAIAHLKQVKERQDRSPKINPRHRVDSVLQLLSRVHDNRSLRPHYEAMYNQCVALLASHFESALREYFISAVAAAVVRGASEVLDEELKLKVRDIRDIDIPFEAYVGHVLSDRKDVSFQDMQSTSRMFQKYFGVKLKRDRLVNNLIAFQACRHAIVHSGATANERTMGQLRDATPRDLKPNLTMGAEVKLTPEEIEQAGSAMLDYFGRLGEYIPTSW